MAMKQARTKSRWLAVVFGLCMWPALCSADRDSERIRMLEQRLDASQRLIERLAARVAELERAASQGAKGERAVASPATAASQPSNAEGEPAIRRLQDTVNQLSEGLALGTRETGVPLHGFADASVGASGSRDPQRLRGFQAGTLDIYLNPSIGDRGRALIETVFEYDRDGGMHVEVERMQLGYTVNDALTLWMGRFHTPMGIWNTAFHHGSHLQTSLARPRFLEFEDRGGILPTHTVGIWAAGRGRLGEGRFVADAFMGNGASVRGRTLDINAFDDDNGGKQLGVSMSYVPGGAWRGLTLGAHALGSTVNVQADDGGLLSRNRLRLVGLHTAVEIDDWSMLGELHQVRTTDLGNRSVQRSSLWYLQLDRTWGVWTPYGRLERADIASADRYFASLRTGRPYRRQLVGLRYELDPRSALKFELSRTSEFDAQLIDGQGLLVPFAATRYNRAAFEYSVAF